MKQNDKKDKIKEIIDSFKYWPRIFKLLWDVDSRYLITITLLSVIGGIVPTVSILLTQELINAIQTSKARAFSYILTPFILYIVVNFIASVIAQIRGYLQSLFQIKVSFKLQLDVLEKAKKFNLSDFENSEIYDKLRRAQSETSGRPFNIFSLILSFISQVITLVSTATILVIWKPWIIIFVVIMPIISSLYMIKLGYIQYKIQWERAPKERKSGYLNYILTNDIAFKEIKLYKLADHFIKDYKKLNKEFINQDVKIIAKRTKLGLLFSLLDELIGAMVCLLIIRSAYVGEILLGSTIAYIRCISNVQGYTEGVLGTISSMCQNNLFIKQLFEFLDLNITEQNMLDDLIYIKNIQNIELVNVSFRYPHRSEYALKNINLKICKGENIALVGQNGSGKTTLVKLISGFYSNYEGEILMNGISMKKINKDSLREKIGIVFQDYNKYELSCRENIALGNLNFINNDEALLDAVKKASAIELIEGLPKGIDTQLGVWFDKGVQLSGGQWQKIALARAFIRNADCYILDEPSSALDPISEYEILQKSYELTKEKIGIFITHRLANLRKVSSRILVLSNGELIEEGTHEQLMDENKYYKYLYKLQNKEKYLETIKGVEKQYGGNYEKVQSI